MKAFEDATGKTLDEDKKELALTMLRGLAKDYESAQEQPTQKEA